MNLRTGPDAPSFERDGDTRDLLAPWLTRRSTGPRRLEGPGPTAQECQWLLQAAANVSDHGRLRPCRIVLADQDQRERYAMAFLAYAAAARGLDSPAGLDAQVRENERSKAFNAPCLLSVVARIADGVHDVPPHEQWMSVGASLGALLGAATALGYAGKALSGSRAAHPAVRAVVCGEGEVLACFVYLGRRPADF